MFDAVNHRATKLWKISLRAYCIYDKKKEEEESKEDTLKKACVDPESTHPY